MAGHSWYISCVAGPATLRAAASRGKIDYFLRPTVGVGAINGPAAALSHGDGGGDRHTTTDGHPPNMILLSSS